MVERIRFDRELEALGVFEFDTPVPAADVIDQAAAQPIWAVSIKNRIEPLPKAKDVKAAVTWNAARHPSQSGVGLAKIGACLGQYVSRAAIEKAMRADADLKDLASDSEACIAVMTQQFQSKVYAEAKMRDGKIGEGTLDALGFVGHIGDKLNAVDHANHRFHSGKDGGGKSDSFRRLEVVYRTNKSDFESVESGLSAQNWFLHFVNPPFLGQPFTRGIHLELIRRLRQGEKKLMQATSYAKMSPVELGAALGIDEVHHGGRPDDKKATSMHTFGLAVDIGYTKNPWVAGQHGAPNRNRKFREVSQNVSRLLRGTSDVLNSGWLHGLGSDSSRTTGAAFDAIKQRHTDLQTYLSLAGDLTALEAAVRSQSLARPRESDRTAAVRWRSIIRADRTKLQSAFGANRRPETGFLNLHRDLVVALRDTGCLAWGAIDIGPGESGDMMHFDCRATGIGRIVEHPSGYHIDAGHPCLPPTAAPSREYAYEFERDTPKPPSVKAWTFIPRVIATPIALYVSGAAAQAEKQELLVYAHGLNTCAPAQKRMPLSFITDEPFHLGKIVENSKRPMILAVPYFDWPDLVSYKMNMGDKKPELSWHRIAVPKTLNAVIVEIGKQVGSMTGKTPSFSRLILAGHSGGYGFLDPIAEHHADPEMSKGCLALLTHVWGFDTSYTCPGSRWEDWVSATNGPKIAIFFGGDKNGTLACGNAFAGLAKKHKDKMTATRIFDHCSAPTANLPKLLKALP